MRHLLLLSIVLAWPAGAADFRGLDFGSSCAPLRSREESQGSTPIPWKTIRGGEFIAFEGRAFERDVSIVYLCIGGRLSAGHYYLPFEDFEGVVKSFGEVREALVESYGRPFLDPALGSCLAAPGQASRPRDPDPTKCISAWRTPRVRISLSLMPRGRGPAPDWRVFVMSSASGG